MPSHIPQLLITLGPNDELIVELPGTSTRHKVELRSGEAEASLRRMLQAQRSDRCELGLDGAPSQAQVLHWERHQQWADERCRFCIAEGRISGRSKRAAPKRERERRSDGVEIIRVREGASGSDAAAAKRQQQKFKDAEEIGL